MITESFIINRPIQNIKPAVKMNVLGLRVITLTALKLMHQGIIIIPVILPADGSLRGLEELLNHSLYNKYVNTVNKMHEAALMLRNC